MPASSTAVKPGTTSCHLRQNRWWVTPLGLGTTSRWNWSSSSSGDCQSRDPDPSSTCETATCMVSTRPAPRNCRIVVAPPPSRTSLPCAASRARSRTGAGSASTKWNVVSPRVNEGRVWWVSTNTGVRNGGSSPHQPRQPADPVTVRGDLALISLFPQGVVRPRRLCRGPTREGRVTERGQPVLRACARSAVRRVLALGQDGRPRRARTNVLSRRAPAQSAAQDRWPAAWPTSSEVSALCANP